MLIFSNYFSPVNISFNINFFFLQCDKKAKDSIKSFNSLRFKNNTSTSTKSLNQNLNYSNEILECKANSYLNLESDCKKKISHVYIREDFEEDSIVETTALRQDSEPSNTTTNNSVASENYLTMFGTIKRGKQKCENVEVILNMSREELEILETNMIKKKGYHCNAEPGSGVHVFLWSVICLPFSVIISAIYSFCIGTITWYSVFTLFSDTKPLAYKILIPPILIVLYPFLIILISIGLGLYAGIKQLSCCWSIWFEEFIDYEKGFYGWLCNSLDVPECSPYEVVILSSVQKP